MRKLEKMPENFTKIFTLPLIPSHQGREEFFFHSPFKSGILIFNWILLPPLPLWERVGVRGINVSPTLNHIKQQLNYFYNYNP
jgi:hypothetical protein